MRYIYFIGTAGSGKSSMVQAYKEWLDNQGIDSIIVNLDPGTDFIPYEADVDIRDWINLGEVMKDYSLGPNGAQIVASDLMAVNTKEWVPAVKKMETNFALIDTPGQMELFAFRQSSTNLVEELGQEDGFLVFLSDPTLARTPNGFVSDMMLAAITQFRFSLPILNVLSKADLLTEEQLEGMGNWSRDPYALYNALTEREMSSQSVMSIEFLKAMENVGMYKELTPVSSEQGTGMEDIYNTIQQYFEGGEDLGRNVS
ncbi:ATP/GTP-binding protein [Methanomassiliicoccus luminyensis]|uniref:PRK13768 family protein n=1 Tax=Methanomassiliicoccus luminyensis TaxID=1080712 RepID=UPI00037DC7E7|nr:ATP/GTP-binding protein [Methanomassiliicoccus luminyensis]